MDDVARQYSLVDAAIRSGTTGCVVWKEGLEKRVRNNAELQGLTPEGIIDLLVEHVQKNSATIRQKPETRDHWRGLSDYVYEVLITVLGLPRDLYVELVLSDPVDEECPIVIIVSAHLTSFPRRK
jgi:hypothetical protein